MAFIARTRSGLPTLNAVLKRNLGASAVVLAKAEAVSDPIQKLFLDKLNEYKTKSSKLQEGELFDSTTHIEAQKKFELENLSRRYGGQNMEEFPKFSFEK